jgi:hypothetical protein
MPPGLYRILVKQSTPEIWARGYSYTRTTKQSSGGVLRSAGSGVVRLGKGVKNLYAKTLPDTAWRDQASLAARLAERAGFLAVPVGGAYYLAGRNSPTQYSGSPYPQYGP